MFNIRDLQDDELVNEIRYRLDEKTSSLKETEFLNKKLIGLNNKLLEQDSVKSQFLSLIKNEFNNPISSLLNLSGRLAINPDTDRRVEISQMINLEVLRLDFQIKNIIAANEIEAGETQNYITKVNLSVLFDDIQKAFKYVVADKSLTILIKDELNGQDVYSDAHKIELIASNLLSNACEFSFANSEITIRYWISDDKLHLEIIDHGEGIAVEQKLDVYNRFARYSQGHTRAQTGLGLGLSIVKGMVEAMDGFIDYSTEIGKTTTFLAIIPCGARAGDSSLGANELFFDDFNDASEM